jgi:hypothetical protein
MRRFVYAVLCLAVTAGVVRAQTYEIKVRQYPAKGQSVKHAETSKQVTLVKVTDEDGKVVQDKKETTDSKTVYVEAALSASDKAGRVAKFSRKYDKATKAIDGGDAKAEAYQGKAILFEKNKEGKYVATGQDKFELGEADAARLLGDLNREARADEPFQQLVADKAVKVGDTWEISGKKLLAFLGDKSVDTEKSKGKGKLVKAYKKGQWGVIEISGDLDLKLENVPSKAEMSLTLEGPIDGSAATGKLEAKVVLTQNRKVEQDCKKYEVAIKSTINTQIDRTAVK